MVDLKAYLTYHIRWQISASVIAVPLWFFTDVIGLTTFVALPFTHVVGAAIFWYVDGYIFNDLSEDDSD